MEKQVNEIQPVSTHENYTNGLEQDEKLRIEHRARNCVFCDIACGDDPTTNLLYKDDNYVAFRNITPAATHHYLIIPKDHIRDGNQLKPHHVPMLERIEEVGREVLEQQGGDMKSYRSGYHWPPFISVPHLHLHVISPVNEMSIFSKLIFMPGTKWFVSTEEILDYLQKRSLISSL